jgi:hypothetical protein
MKALSKPIPIKAFAHVAGAIYLSIIVFGGYTQAIVMSSFLVAGDSAATMRNILADQHHWNTSALLNLIVPIIAVVQIWLEYVIFKPVNRNLALLFLMLNMANAIIEALGKLFLLMVMPILKDSGLQTVFDRAQISELAGLALTAHTISFNISLIFFGAACLVLGHLIKRSGFLPKIIGWMMQAAGSAYLVLCFSALFAAKLVGSLEPVLFGLVLLGEGSLCLWLLIKGVAQEPWHRLTSANQAQGDTI